jgi:predicted N-acyltransferase
MNYRTGIVSSLAEIGEAAWSQLLAQQADANPFLSFAFLHALHESDCVSSDTGWQPQYLVLWQGDALAAAMPLYVKSHSYGEYECLWRNARTV